MTHIHWLSENRAEGYLTFYVPNKVAFLLKEHLNLIDKIYSLKNDTPKFEKGFL